MEPAKARPTQPAPAPVRAAPHATLLRALLSPAKRSNERARGACVPPRTAGRARSFRYRSANDLKRPPLLNLFAVRGTFRGREEAKSRTWTPATYRQPATSTITTLW
eukprot:1942207-Prymnesium_polylepis.1